MINQTTNTTATAMRMMTGMLPNRYPEPVNLISGWILPIGWGPLIVKRESAARTLPLSEIRQPMVSRLSMVTGT